MANNDKLSKPLSLKNQATTLLKQKKKQEEKVAALMRLAKIRARIEYYKSMKQAPPSDLIQDAQVIANQFSDDNDIQKILDVINNTYHEAVRIAEANIIFNMTSNESWLDSAERRAFDAAIAKDPLETLAKHLEDPSVEANLKIIDEIIAGTEISAENLNDAVNQAQSEEMRYKRNAFFYHVPCEIEKLKLQGRAKEQEVAEENLANVVKEEVLDQVVLQRKAIRRAERRSTEHDVVIKEDKPLIVEGVKQVVTEIEQNIEGGLIAVGKAGNKVTEVIQDVILGNVEQAARKTVEQQNINSAIARVELQQKATKKQEEIQVEKVDIKQDKKEIKIEKTDDNADKQQQDENNDQSIDDKEAKRLAKMAKRKKNKSQTKEPQDPSQLRKVLKNQTTVPTGENKSRTPNHTPTIHNHDPNSLNK